MTLRLPAIDAHAHVETTVRTRDLEGLDALVFAVTREPSEWGRALARADQLALWGIGVHPGVPKAAADFDPAAFAAALPEALLVGEVGLDGRSKVPLARQTEILDAVLEAVQATPRPVSIHSVEASAHVLEALQRRPVAAPILHWWRGDEHETETALELGCFFSLNGAEVLRPRVLDLLPPDRVLTETDFPHTRKADPRAKRPAAVETIETALAQAWSLDRVEIRRRLWQTVGAVAELSGIEDSLPARVQEILLTVGTAASSP